jgi:uncharacterized membrane protein YfcA
MYADGFEWLLSIFVGTVIGVWGGVLLGHQYWGGIIGLVVGIIVGFVLNRRLRKQD